MPWNVSWDECTQDKILILCLLITTLLYKCYSYVCIHLCVFVLDSLCLLTTALSLCLLINSMGLILLVLNIIMYLTRNHLVWFLTFITLLLVLLLTCCISRFIVIVDSWNANKIQIQYKLKICTQCFYYSSSKFSKFIQGKSSLLQ